MDILNLVGLILPPFIDFINKYVVDSKVKFVISMFVSLVVAGVILAFQGKLALNLNSVPNLLVSAATVFAEAQIVYKMLYKDSALERKIGA